MTLRRLTVLATIVHHSAPVGDLVGALRASGWLRTPTDSFRPAKEIASLDLVSDGQVIFGVGTGWSREEMRNHGTDPRTRGSLMNERLAAIKEIWTKDEAEFHGTYVDFDPVFCWPKPVQRPHPPVYIGGDGEAALARVAAHGDGWMPHSVGHPGRVRSQLNRLAEVAGDVPVMVASVSPVPELVAAYAEAGADRVALTLPTAPKRRHCACWTRSPSSSASISNPGRPAAGFLTPGVRTLFLSRVCRT